MKSPLLITLKLTLALIFLLPVPALSTESLQGSWQCQGNDGMHVLQFQNDSSLVYDGETSEYALLPNVILVRGDDGLSSYGYRLDGNMLSIRFPDGSMLKCQKGQGGGLAGMPQASGADSTALQRDIAGTWWGYAGSTERKIGLCPDGSYIDFTESSYSGRSHDAGGNRTGAWGAVSQGGNRGRWSIQGNYQRGIIRVQTTTGNQLNLSYRQVGEPGCLDINGNRLCRTSARCE